MNASEIVAGQSLTLTLEGVSMRATALRPAFAGEPDRWWIAFDNGDCDVIAPAQWLMPIVEISTPAEPPVGFIGVDHDGRVFKHERAGWQRAGVRATYSWDRMQAFGPLSELTRKPDGPRTLVDNDGDVWVWHEGNYYHAKLGQKAWSREEIEDLYGPLAEVLL